MPKGKSNNHTRSEAVSKVSAPQNPGNSVFENGIISTLYQYDFNIPSDVLNTILELPRESLIRDLRKVLSDSIERYDYFFRDKSLTENETFFAAHAFFIIGEKELIEMLPDIHTVLDQQEEYNDFYFGYIGTEFIWMTLYKLCISNISILFDLLKAPLIDLTQKFNINLTLQQLYYHNPDLQKAITLGYKKLTPFILKHHKSKTIFDTDTVSDIVCAMGETAMGELDQEIRQLYAAGLVEISFAGTYESLIRDSRLELPLKINVLNIHALYAVIKTWDD